MGYDDLIYLFFELPVYLCSCKLTQARLILFKIPPSDLLSRNEESLESRYKVYPLLDFFNIYSCLFSPPDIDYGRKIVFHNNENSSYTEIDITQIVKDWVENEIENKGLLLTGSKNSKNITYASDRYKVAGMRPMIRLTYEGIDVCHELSCVPCEVKINYGSENRPLNEDG